MKKGSKDRSSAGASREDSGDAEAATADCTEAAPPTPDDGLAHSGSAGADEDPVKLLEARIETLENGILRAKADYQNLQRRSAAERSDAVRYANAEILRALLVVADDFERALQASRTHESAETIADGIQIVSDHFNKALRDQGLETIDALHQPFDPAVHEAMMQQPTDEHPPGTVVEEIAKGYRLHDRVIRPTKVVVATTPADPQGGGDRPD